MLRQYTEGLEGQAGIQRRVRGWDRERVLGECFHLKGLEGSPQAEGG